MTTLPWITEAEAGPCDWPRLVEALAEGHRGDGFEVGDTFLTRGADVMLSRSAWVDGLGVGVKSVTVFPANPGRGRPSVQGAMLVFDDATGAPRALIDSALLTNRKTVADSVLGAKLLAREDARRLLVVGAGSVAGSLIPAYRAVLGIAEVTLWNRTRERAEELAARLDGVTVADDLHTALAGADIVSCATMAKGPVLQGAALAPGTHVNLIGAFTADMREADDAALRRGRLFVDAYETTIGHIGELVIPMQAGVITREDVLGDLRALVAGESGRRSDADITLFKNGGGAHLDLMTAAVILEAAGH